jgi:hypothetical protein
MENGRGKNQTLNHMLVHLCFLWQFLTSLVLVQVFRNMQDVFLAILDIIDDSTSF